MPVCEGRPDGPCPAGRNDKTVRLCQGDLLLCAACENFRFPSDRHQAAASGSGRAADAQLHTDGLSSSVPTASTTTTLHGELLAYVNFFRQRSKVDALRKVILSFYSTAEIAESKKILLDMFSSKLPTDCTVKAKRVKSAGRQVHEAEVEDILAIFNILDDLSALDGMVFNVVAIDRLPGVYSPEDISLCSIADRQNRMEAAVASLAADITTTAAANDGASALNGVVEAVDKLDDKLQKDFLGLQNQIDLLTATCGKMVESMQSTVVHNEESKKSKVDSDRAMNIVCSGIRENRDNLMWRDEVATVLQLTAGKDVEIVDAFRLGRYTAGKTRPVLVKLVQYGIDVWFSAGDASWLNRMISGAESTCTRMSLWRPAGV